MKTLKELIEAKRCRTGAADGTTKSGAYWIAVDPITIRSYGGDGIGQSGAYWRHRLQLRHYRDGSVRAVIHAEGYHQNDGTQNGYYLCDGILSCATIEEVVVALKGLACGDTHAYSDSFGRKNLTEALSALGMPEAEPAPDELVA